MGLIADIARSLWYNKATSAALLAAGALYACNGDVNRVVNSSVEGAAYELDRMKYHEDERSFSDGSGSFR